MGIVDPYFPKELSLRMAEISKAEIFIETGTYMGGTAKWAGTEFKNVHTIELSDFLYNQNKEDILSKGNIVPYLGDSRLILPEILSCMEKNAVFWLDGHYSGGVTAGAVDPCPLLKELEIILSRGNEDIIIIDDARCAIGVDGWPSIVEIYLKMNQISKYKRNIHICNDHIYIIPDKSEYNTIILEYIQKNSMDKWEMCSKLNYLKNKINFNLDELYEKHKEMNWKEKFHSNVVKFLKKTGTYKIVRCFYRKLKKKI